MRDSLLTRLCCGRLLLAGDKPHHTRSMSLLHTPLGLDYRDHIHHQFRYRSSIFVSLLPHMLQRLSAMFLLVTVRLAQVASVLVGFSSDLLVHNSGSISAMSIKSHRHIRCASFMGTGGKPLPIYTPDSAFSVLSMLLLASGFCSTCFPNVVASATLLSPPSGGVATRKV